MIKLLIVILIILLFGMFCFKLVTGDIYSDETIYGIREEPKVIVFDNNTGRVNGTDFWDLLDYPNATQMEQSNEELNIKESWLTTLGNTLWCKLTGCTITGDLNITGNVNVTGRLNVGENATFEKDVIINGTLYGTSPVRIAGGLNLITGFYAGDGSGLFNFNLNLTNLTIGDRITFRLGETIDNLIDGLILITGNLSVTERVGIGTTSPNAELDVRGDANITGDLNVAGDIYSNNYQVLSYQRTVNITNVTMTAVI